MEIYALPTDAVVASTAWPCEGFCSCRESLFSILLRSRWQECEQVHSVLVPTRWGCKKSGLEGL
eukprot:6474167-Amphidinium_carterae.4